jgi:hypothetical protein
MNADFPGTQSPSLPADLPAWLASQPVQPEIGAAHPDDAGRILQAALAILSQGEQLLTHLAPEHFAQSIPVAFNASIGGHYRHCLDHFASIVRSVGGKVVDYEDRERDPRIETQPEFALQITRELRQALAARLARDRLERDACAHRGGGVEAAIGCAVDQWAHRARAVATAVGAAVLRIAVVVRAVDALAFARAREACEAAALGGGYALG